MEPRSANGASWPALPFEEWRDTCATLHMFAQVVGKVRLALAPPVNHWWHVPLYVNAVGLTTSAIPHAGGVFEIVFDFVDHVVRLETSSGDHREILLAPRPVAVFHADLLAALRSLGIAVKIWRMPVEVPNPIPFDEDRQHASYDREPVRRFWRALMAMEPVFQAFRGKFVGKASPVHFFWGSFDLAASRFSGRRAPERPDADAITREGYSHEVISAGFWPGGNGAPDASFYAYAAPEPEGFSETTGLPAGVSYNRESKFFLLPYENVRRAPSPEASLREFLQSTYEAGANLAGWDRRALERP